MGVTMGVLFHELGHAMIGELALPATGPEEDAADEFSAVAMSMFAGETDRLLVNTATYSSLLWWHWAQKKEREGQHFAWHGEHAPDIRRFRNTFCILFGANPGGYNQLADRVRVDQVFKDKCAASYGRKVEAWESILALRARDLGPDSPGVYHATTPGGRINWHLDDSSNEYAQYARALAAGEGWAELMGVLSRYLVWPRDLLVEFRDCGELNAWYDPAAGRVTMCYDLIRYASQIVLQAEGIAAVPSQRGSIMSFVQGTWSARVLVASHPLDVAITYRPDQTYLIEEVWVPAGLQPGGLAARIEGTWAAVEGAAANQMFIHRQPEQWLPQEGCYYSQAACGSETQAYPAQIIDQNAIYVDGIVWSRTR